VATPVGGDVGKPFETMGNAVVDLFLVRVGFVVGLADTLCDDLGVTLAVTGVLAVRTLHACGILEEFSTQRTAHDVVELLSDELVTLLFVNLFLLLTHSTLTVKTDIERTTVLQLFGCVQLAWTIVLLGKIYVLPKLI
jgi:phosphatidylglycerophosphatase A